MTFANVILIAGMALSLPIGVTAQPREIIGYYPSWKWRTQKNLLTPKTIPYQKLTIINYAFFYPQPDGWIVGRDTVGDALILGGEHDPATGMLKPGTRLTDYAHKHNVRVMLSIGGWESSENFPQVAADPVKRAHFAHSCLERIREFGFDGIDVDWEYPGYAEHKGSPQDKGNFTLLLHAVKDSLRTEERDAGQNYLLTAALSSHPSRIADIELLKVGEILDYLNIMTYDFYGPWDPRSNHNAPLYPSEGGDSTRTLDASFRLLHYTYGIPAEKINLGVPFYGQTFAGCTALDAPHAGTDTVHFSKHGAFYYDIMENIRHFTRYWDDRAKVPYLVSSSWKMFVSYDDEESVGYKARYVLEHEGAGVIIWEITGDNMPDGTTPLLNVIYSSFAGPQQKRN